MELTNFFRPPEDTGIGFHYFPDTGHYRREDLNRWVPELKMMGTSWLTVISDLTQRIPKAFICELIANHIEPVVRIYTPVVCPVDLDALRQLAKDYGKWGVHYAHIFNEPNQDYAWNSDEWSKPALVERFTELQLPCLQVMAQAGLTPLFAPLAPGGAFWDLSFFKTALAILAARAQPSLIEQMGICVHNYAFNRPLTWGKGGAARWPEARPYQTPPASQDQRGFYLFEWYDQVARAQLGRSLPQLCGENGCHIGDAQQSGYPPITPERHAQLHVEMSKLVMEGQVPDYYFNNAFWLLAAESDSQAASNAFEEHAWFKAEGKLPAVDALGALRKHPRKRAQPKPNPDKPLYHYVILPASESGASEWYWGMVSDYVRAFRPICGFDADEARLARYVTIIGNLRGVSDKVEESLRAAGCQVERIAGRNGAETQAILQDMARRGKRFRLLETSTSQAQPLSAQKDQPAPKAPASPEWVW
jgi:hypothetical protein